MMGADSMFVPSVNGVITGATSSSSNRSGRQGWLQGSPFIAGALLSGEWLEMRA
jgi:hypothetical protein